MSTRILFVCLGNICRSPTAEGVFAKMAGEAGADVEVDSAGTSGWHIGDPPDRRAQTAAQRRGVNISRLQARKVVAEDFAAFDLILAMDDDNLAKLRQAAPADAKAELRLFLDYAPDTVRTAIPDPYYGAGDGFELVLDLIEAASRGLLAELEAQKP
jgi:protein-tyrosine phosphatase